jgi:hypothetical protein
VQAEFGAKGAKNMYNSAKYKVDIALLFMTFVHGWLFYKGMVH